MEPETIIKQALRGKYKILEIIGKGGMATVYRAIQTNLNRQVALKVIHQNMVHDEEFIKRFKREAQVCSSINHTNIVTVYDVGSVGSVHFMSMEYLEGRTLREIINTKGPLEANDIVRYISPVAVVLGIMHRNGIVHRDIKSSNIFITYNGRAVLMDFGVVFTEGREPLSLSGSILGTPEYMSPEQAEGKLKVDGRSDIYSLGVVMFECLTGKLPFHSDNYIATLYNVLNEPPPSITSINPKAPRWISAIVFSCLQKDRNLRIQDGFTLAKSLRENEKLKLSGNNGNNESFTRKIFPAETLIQKLPEIFKKHSISTSLKDKLLKSLIIITSVIILAIIGIKFGTGHIKSGKEQGASVEIDYDSLYKQFKKSQDTSQISVAGIENNIAGHIANNIDKVTYSDSDRELDEEIRKNIEEGDRMQKEGLFEEALIKYRQVLKLDSKNNLVSQRINKTSGKLREFIISRGDDYLLENKYDSAISIYSTWKQFDPNDNIIKTRLKKATTEKEEYKKHLSLTTSIASREEKLHQLGIKMIRVESRPLGNFYLGESEVTQNLWESIMGSNPSHIKGDMLPVENVSYDDIQSFLYRLNQNLGLNLRLPSENEWEWAASGGNNSKGFKYSGSNKLSVVAWYINNSDNVTHRVNSLEGNELGFYDMSGNVWEWCSTLAIGGRVLKGGSWLSTNMACAINYRQTMYSDKKDYTAGFRLCRTE